VKKWKEYEKEFKDTKKEFDKLRKRKVNKKMEPEFLKLLKKYLLSLYEPSDDSLSLSELKQKYEDDIKQVDLNWWIFSKISNDFNYQMHKPNNILRKVFH